MRIRTDVLDSELVFELTENAYCSHIDSVYIKSSRMMTAIDETILSVFVNGNRVRTDIVNTVDAPSMIVELIKLYGVRN